MYNPFVNQPYIYKSQEEYETNMQNLGMYQEAKKKDQSNNDGMSYLADIFRIKMEATKDQDMINEAEPDVSYPTGFLNIDYLMGYISKEYNTDIGALTSYYSLGFTDGTFISVIGNSNVGKSTFVEQTAANIARRFRTTTVFIDSTEAGGMTEVRRLHLSKFTKDEYKKRYIIRNSGVNVENIYQRIKTISDLKKEKSSAFLYDTGHRDMYGNPIIKHEPTIYVIDSIAGLMPADMMDEDELGGNTIGAKTAAKIASLVNGVIQMLKSTNIILIGTNHISQDIQMSRFQQPPALPWLKQGERIPKGRKASLLSNHVIRLDRVAKLNPEDGYKIQGSVVNFSLVKSRTSGNKEPMRMIYDFANGFDPWLSILEHLKYNKLLYGAGAFLSFEPEKQYKFSYGNFREQIYSDPEFRNAFIHYTLPILKKIPIEVDERAKDMHIDDILNNQELYSIL